MYKQFFTQFLKNLNGKLHFAAHSHHLWPDITRQAALDYWDDSARLIDDKWDLILNDKVPEAQKHIASILKLNNPERIAFAPNTHEFVARLLSCLDYSKTAKVLTTDSEFHSFSRQAKRLEETGKLLVERISVEPFNSFETRLKEKAAEGDYDMLFFSQVMFNSGFAVTDIEGIVNAVPDGKIIVIDAYHAFCALPTNLSGIQDRVFYMAGGYKYAMSGEAVCFLHLPIYANSLRPMYTGWFATFGDIGNTQKGVVEYSNDAYRFWGSTFDPTGIYRFNATMNMLEQNYITIDKKDIYVKELILYFIDKLKQENIKPIFSIENIAPEWPSSRGHFITFRLANAEEINKQLRIKNVITDYRGDRLRFGFGIYHDTNDIDNLILILKDINKQAELIKFKDTTYAD